MRRTSVIVNLLSTTIGFVVVMFGFREAGARRSLQKHKLKERIRGVEVKN